MRCVPNSKHAAVVLALDSIIHAVNLTTAAAVQGSGTHLFGYPQAVRGTS
jgi:hypothetical protein